MKPKRCVQLTTRNTALNYLVYIDPHSQRPYHATPTTIHNVDRYLVYIPVLLATAAWIGNCLVGFRCNMIRFAPHNSFDEILQDLGTLVDEDFQVPVLALGPWLRKSVEISVVRNAAGPIRILVRDECVPLWNDDIHYLDGKWRAVRVLTTLILVVGATATLALVLSLFTAGLCTRVHWKILAALFGLGLSLSQGLILMLHDSDACWTNPLLRQLSVLEESKIEIWTTILGLLYDRECQWSQGSTVNVVAAACWFLTGLSMFILGEPVH